MRPFDHGFWHAERAEEDQMFCAREQADIPESLLRYEEAWGWVHRTDEPHQVDGTPLDDGRRTPPGRTAEPVTGSGTPDG
jgi:hypothetical protein